MPSVVYAIGDVHGCLDLLCALEDLIAKSAAGIPGRKVIVMLGDYVDRGPRSAQVIDHLLAPPPAGIERVCLAGNHEKLMITALRDQARLKQWLDLGGRDTLLSYGIDGALLDMLPRSAARFEQAIKGAIPRSHLEFLDRLPVVLSAPGLLFVHGGVRADAPLAAHTDDDLLNLRMPDADWRHTELGTAVHGHTPVAEVLIGSGQIAVDTEAYRTGKLSCVQIEFAPFRATALSSSRHLLSKEKP